MAPPAVDGAVALVTPKPLSLDLGAAERNGASRPPAARPTECIECELDFSLMPRPRLNIEEITESIWK
jgi:hypothetical protein